MRERRANNALRISVTTLALVLIAAAKYDLERASMMVVLVVVGLVNVFGLFDLAVSIYRRQRVSPMLYVAAVCAVLGSAALVLRGYAGSLFLITVCLLLIDAVLLRVKQS